MQFNILRHNTNNSICIRLQFAFQCHCNITFSNLYQMYTKESWIYRCPKNSCSDDFYSANLSNGVFESSQTSTAAYNRDAVACSNSFFCIPSMCFSTDPHHHLGSTAKWEKTLVKVSSSLIVNEAKVWWYKHITVRQQQWQISPK